MSSQLIPLSVAVLLLVSLSLAHGARVARQARSPDAEAGTAGEVPLPPLPYCAAPFPFGAEGKLSPAEAERVGPGLQLKQVQILFRHGSRNPENTRLGSLPNHTNPPDYVCRPMAPSVEGIVKSWPKLFPVVNDSSPSVPKDLPFLEVEASGKCKGGQLIQQGIQQLLMKGQALREAYPGLLSQLADSDVWAQSTPYPRTRATTAALLSGVLGDLREAQARGVRIPILQNSSIDRIPSSFPVDKACPRSAAAGTAAYRSFPKQCDHLPSKLATVFGSPVNPLLAADVLLSDSCVQKALPCGPSSCVSEVLGAEVVSCDGSWWRNAYTDNPDHCLGAYPFLQRMPRKMQSRYKLVLHGDHDTGVIAVACALGFSDGVRPRLASHIAFEVWKREEGKETKSWWGSWGSWFRGPGEGELADWFVRIVYNGAVVTDRICGRELCTMREFKDAIEANVRRYGARTYEEACKLES